jgi:uncharacterized protein GlcG (DUF336 family)
MAFLVSKDICKNVPFTWTILNNILPLFGGVLIKNKEGEIIGAIGISGETIKQDHAIATFGAEAII